MLAVLLGVVLAGSLVALADVASSYESELRSFTRAHWMRSVMVPVLGPLLWTMYGRPRIVKARRRRAGTCLRTPPPTTTPPTSPISTA
ncbi:MAG TPA: hypothetical protein VIL68_06530 [Propionibacteriaceae bacterium]